MEGGFKMPKYTDFDLDLQKQAPNSNEQASASIACHETIKYRSCCKPCDNTDTYCVAL